MQVVPLAKVKMLFLVMTLLLIVALSVILYLVFWNKSDNESLLSSQNKQTIELNQVLEKVGKLMVLPTDDIPSLAIISDTAKLKSQPFFAKAKVGDYVIMYSKLGKAILYDSKINKIVEVGALNLPDKNDK